MSEAIKSQKRSFLTEAFLAFVANTSDIVYVISDEMEYLAASEAFAEHLGKEGPGDVVGRSALAVGGLKFSKKHAHTDKEVIKNGKSVTGFVETIPGKSGERYVLTSKYAVAAENGHVKAVLSISRDITRDYEAQEDYWREVQYLLGDREASGAWLIDADSWRIADARVRGIVYAVFPPHMSLGDFLETARKTTEESDEARRLFNTFSKDSLRAIFKSGKRRVDADYRLTLSEGGCWVHLSLRLLTDPVTGHLMAIVTLVDIDSAKTAQHELIKAAELDSMTGVLNHDAAFSYMGQYLSGEGASGVHALIMIDRDGLKRINDSFGHQAGDEIIIETARVLQSSFRDTDIIGRVGGDEFLVLMKNIGKQQIARRKAAELLQSLQCICGPADNAMESTGSIGVSLYNGDNKTLDKLYAEADTALYKAKTGGRNRYAFFEPGSDGPSFGEGEHDPLMDTVNLRTLLNSIDGGILILHDEAERALTPVFFSDSFLTMMGGLTQSEAFALYGGRFFECIHPDERERVRAEFSQAMGSNGPLRTTYRLVGKDGNYRWLSAGTNVTKNPDGTTDIYAVHTNIEKLMSREERLASDELRYRVAFSQTARTIFEVDIANDTLLLYPGGGEHSDAEARFQGLPEVAIETKFVDAESADAFRAFYELLRAGKAEDTALFKCRYFTTSEYGWTSIAYKTVFDGEGRPVKAIGSIEELPNIAHARDLLEREERLMAPVGEELLTAIKANISKDTIDFVSAAEDNVLVERAEGSYSKYAALVISSTSYSEDSLLLQLNLSRDALLEAYSGGRRYVAVEYRRIDSGEIRWTGVNVSLIEDPVTRNVYAFIYENDIEKRRGVEAVLPVTIERDKLTHLYTEGTVERLIGSLMRGAGTSERLYSLALIRSVGLSELGARIGKENVELELVYLGRLIGILMSGDCIVGRYGADSFLVFCPDSQSDEWMRGRIEHTVSRVRSMYSPDDPGAKLKLVCGIATDSARTAGFDALLSQAIRVCDTYHNCTEDKVHTFEQYVDSFRITDEELEVSAFMPVSRDELTRPLFGEEKEALSECMVAMLAGDSCDASINGALGRIGKYYDAQRVYTIVILEGGKTVSGQNEWMAAGRHSTLRQITGVALEKLPMFKRAMAAAKPIVLDGRSRNVTVEGGSGQGWSFITLPVIIETRVRGFMCIENPRLHKTDVALPSALIPIINRVRTRYGVNASGRVVGRDELTGLMDHSAYNTAMQSYNPDAFHAVGAFYVAAINLRELNRIKGNEYGDDMLVFAAQTLTNTFKKATVYRMSGPEFAVIANNLSREAFQGHCARVESVLQRRYPKRFCFGVAWSNKSTSARKLVTDAESFAHNGVEKTVTSISRPGKDEENIRDIKEGLANGSFYILLQPQMDMRTGRIIGVEALARCRNSAGQMILPAEFVQPLEEAGHIRDLDYFVLDQTFRCLQEWIMRGYKPVPISVNFSRQTLLSSSVLASALAIRSRYDVPEDLVEIEVTESIGDYEPGPIRDAMDGMCQQGFKFVLDDLGSEYSSLKTLGDLTFDAIKLDKSLIDSFLYNSMSRSVVESIVSLCAKNNVRCIAEGVKSEEQVKGLLEVGCIYAQGYYYGKPMPTEDFQLKYLRKR